MASASALHRGPPENNNVVSETCAQYVESVQMQSVSVTLLRTEEDVNTPCGCFSMTMDAPN